MRSWNPLQESHASVYSSSSHNRGRRWYRWSLCPLAPSTHLHTLIFTQKGFLVLCQLIFIKRFSPLFIFTSNRLSSPVLVLPVPPTPPLLSAERLLEMDVMRQLHAGRETEAALQSRTTVNKVKNNQVRVGHSSPRACCSQPHSCTTIHHFLLQKWLFFSTFSQLLLVSPYSLAFALFVLIPVLI